MSNEVGKNSKGIKDFLLGKKAKKAESQQEPGPQSAPEVEAAPTAAPEPPTDPFLIKPLQDGNLMKLWEHWIQSVPRPAPSFACGGREIELFGGERELIMESRLIMARIEQDAQRTLRLIEQLQKMSENGEERHLDASCLVYRPKNLMVAWIFLIPPWGKDAQFPEDVIESALKTNAVTYGIDTAVLEEIKKNPSYLTPIPIAYGVPPVLGQDGKIVELFPRKLSKEIKLDANGVAEYRMSNFAQAVNEGQTICEIIAPVIGTAGINVEGKTVEPPPPKAARVPAGSNTAVNAEGTKLVATISGHLEYLGNGFTVKPVLAINGDVDFNVGNIDMLGDVHIRGDVREGFSVKASGNIIIEGMVESATVEAGGDVVVIRGIVGNNNVFVKAGGQARAKFMENCIVYAGQAVVAECILSSTVYSDGTVETMNGRGTIIGGTLTVTKSVKARVIGSEFGTATKITLGALANVQRQLAEIKVQLESAEKELDEINKNLNYFAINPTPAGEARASRERLRRSILLMQHQKHLDKRAELEAMIPDLSLCKVDAAIIHPQTTVTVGRYSWSAEDRKDNCILIYNTSSCELVQV